MKGRCLEDTKIILLNRGQGARLLADVSAMCSNFEMTVYPASTFISIPTIWERMKLALDGVRIVPGDIS